MLHIPVVIRSVISCVSVYKAGACEPELDDRRDSLITFVENFYAPDAGVLHHDLME